MIENTYKNQQDSNLLYGGLYAGLYGGILPSQYTDKNQHIDFYGGAKPPSSAKSLNEVIDELKSKTTIYNLRLDPGFLAAKSLTSPSWKENVYAQRDNDGIHLTLRNNEGFPYPSSSNPTHTPITANHKVFTHLHNI